MIAERGKARAGNLRHPFVTRVGNNVEQFGDSFAHAGAPPPEKKYRAHLAEFGIVAPVGRKGVEELLHVVADSSDKRVPEIARACLAALGKVWAISAPDAVDGSSTGT